MRDSVLDVLLPHFVLFRRVVVVLHAVTIRRIRIRIADGGHGCDSIRGVAFRATCAGCGYTGPPRSERIAAVADGRAHRLSEGVIESSGTT